MAIVEYALDGKVAIITMKSGENRFNFPFFEAFSSVLDEIENKTSASALVITSAHEKIWSNGIDLDWLRPNLEKEGPELMRKFLTGMHGLFKRVLSYPMITIAAIGGHAFAGGAFLACSCDFRFMRSDRGWFCFPEIDLQMLFSPTLISIMKKAVPRYKIEEMQFTGKRLTAQECEAHNIVVKACHLNDLMREVLNFAKGFDKDRETLRGMKNMMYKDIFEIMDEDERAMAREERKIHV